MVKCKFRTIVCLLISVTCAEIRMSSNLAILGEFRETETPKRTLTRFSQPTFTKSFWFYAHSSVDVWFVFTNSPNPFTAKLVRSLSAGWKRNPKFPREGVKKIVENNLSERMFVSSSLMHRSAESNTGYREQSMTRNHSAGRSPRRVTALTCLALRYRSKGGAGLLARAGVVTQVRSAEESPFRFKDTEEIVGMELDEFSTEK